MQQADGKLPPAEQRGYKHVGDALLRVAREEGVLTYWRCVYSAVSYMMRGIGSWRRASVPQ